MPKSVSLRRPQVLEPAPSVIRRTQGYLTATSEDAGSFFDGQASIPRNQQSVIRLGIYVSGLPADELPLLEGFAQVLRQTRPVIRPGQYVIGRFLDEGLLFDVGFAQVLLRTRPVIRPGFAISAISGDSDSLFSEGFSAVLAIPGRVIRRQGVLAAIVISDEWVSVEPGFAQFVNLIPLGPTPGTGNNSDIIYAGSAQHHGAHAGRSIVGWR